MGEQRNLQTMMSQTASRPVVFSQVSKEIHQLAWEQRSTLLPSTSVHMCDCFCFCSAAFSIFALLLKTADAETTILFKKAREWHFPQRCCQRNSVLC